ncbi:MAG: DUF2911 domain-containing protein [Chthoniobacterales bacterium]
MFPLIQVKPFYMLQLPRRSRFVPLIVGLLALSPALRAAEEKIEFPSVSQHQNVKQRVGVTDIEVDYSRPNKNEREIFGALVPYDKVWRTGANATTKIKFSGPVKLEGKEIPEGEYVLFTVPGATEWTVIIYKDTKVPSAGDYKQENDLARIAVKPVPLADAVESFTIGFDAVKGPSAVLHLDWDKTRVPVKLETDDVEKVSKQLAAAGANLDPALSFQAASFYYDNNKDMTQAAKWVDQALAKTPEAAFIHLRKAQIEARLGNKKEAAAAAQKAIELQKASKAPDENAIKTAQQIIDSAK